MRYYGKLMIIFLMTLDFMNKFNADIICILICLCVCFQKMFVCSYQIVNMMYTVNQGLVTLPGRIVM